MKNLWRCPVCGHVMTEEQSKGYRGCPTGMHFAQHEANPTNQRNKMKTNELSKYESIQRAKARKVKTNETDGASLTLEEVEQDRQASIRDLEALQKITYAMHDFIYNSCGEDRRFLSPDLMKWEGMFRRATRLHALIEAKLNTFSVDMKQSTD